MSYSDMRESSVSRVISLMCGGCVVGISTFGLGVLYNESKINAINNSPEVRAVVSQNANLEALERLRDSPRSLVPYDTNARTEGLINDVLSRSPEQQRSLDGAIAYVKEDIQKKSDARYDSLMEQREDCSTNKWIFAGVGGGIFSLGILPAAYSLCKPRRKRNQKQALRLVA